MHGVSVPDPRFPGAFRGEAGLDGIEVAIGQHMGIAADQVASALAHFEQILQRATGHLDEILPPGADPDADTLGAIIDLCAWAHAEWVRIHPFANGNGRTTRLWANSLAMRYGLPPFVRLRPRPDGGYSSAGAEAMLGRWQSTAVVFRRMMGDVISEPDDGS